MFYVTWRLSNIYTPIFTHKHTHNKFCTTDDRYHGKVCCSKSQCISMVKAVNQIQGIQEHHNKNSKTLHAMPGRVITAPVLLNNCLNIFAKHSSAITPAKLGLISVLVNHQPPTHTSLKSSFQAWSDEVYSTYLKMNCSTWTNSLELPHLMGPCHRIKFSYTYKRSWYLSCQFLDPETDP